MFRNTIGALPWLLLAVSRFANAACECGYSLNSTSNANHAVFTELQETDFLHADDKKDLTKYGWRPVEYNVSVKNSRGPFGKMFELDNVVVNPLKSGSAWSGASKHGGDAGLELWVRSNASDGFVDGAEVQSVRDDVLLGSFRVGMKMSNSSGTCGAFFFFHSDSQEIDMEFLSHQFNSSGGVVNLVLQTPQSVNQGYDASGTSGFEVQPLPFRPDEKFHEYRFDWTSDRVTFYVDGQFLHEMTENVPVESGHLLINHWSNGDPKWSAGPPEQDTLMTISYMKAYFNSTNTERSQDDYKKRCPKFDPAKVCEIPAQTSPPDASQGEDGAKTYFFSQDSGNKVVDQIVYNAASPFSVSAVSIIAPLLVTLFSWSLA